MNKLIKIVAVAGLVASTSVLAADIAAGERKAKEVCAACHGADGNKTQTPDYPKLGGQNADYLEHALLAYKSGARKDAVMAAMAQPLSKAEIANLAAWFASQRGLTVKKD